MRKLVAPLVLMLVVAGVGAVLAGSGADPLVGVMAGATLVAAAATIGLRTDRVAWVTTCLLLLTISWNGLRVGGGAIGNVPMVLAFGSMVAHAVLNRRPVAAPPMLLLAALGFLLASLLSMIIPPGGALRNLTDVQLASRLGAPPLLGQRSDVLTLIQVELSFLVIPLVIMAAGTTAARCSRLMDLWTVGVIANAFVGLTDSLGIIHLAPYPLSSGARSVGLTIHPNYLALSAVMAIPTAMVWFTRSARWRPAAYAGVVTLLGGVYASGSRAGAVSAVVAVVATALVIPRLRRGMLLALPVLGMVGIVLLMFTQAGDHILSQVRLGGGTDLSVQGSNAERSSAADVAIAQFRARPLQGVGFSVITDAHNIYLQLLAAGGLIALASFLAFCGGLVAAVRRGLRGTQRPEVAAAGVAVMAWLGNGVVDNQVGDKYLYVVPGLLLAMARVAGRAPAAAPVPPAATVPPATPALPVIVPDAGADRWDRRPVPVA